MQQLNINFHLYLADSENSALNTIPVYDIHEYSNRKRLKTHITLNSLL